MTVADDSPHREVRSAIGNYPNLSLEGSLNVSDLKTSSSPEGDGALSARTFLIQANVAGRLTAANGSTILYSGKNYDHYTEGVALIVKKDKTNTLTTRFNTSF